MNQNLILKIRVLFIIIVLLDGSTDKGILEEEIMYIHYLLNNKPVTKFAVIKKTNKEDAQGILSVIVEDLKSFKHSESMNDDEYLVKVYKKLINGDFDGASVMSSYKTRA